MNPLEVFDNRFKIGSDRQGAVPARHRTIQTVIYMVLNQGPFRLGNGFFDGVKLLGNIRTGALCLNHRDNA